MSPSSSQPTPLRPPLILPSILSADFARLGEQVRAVAAAGGRKIHVDVMDGHYVPNLTIGPLVVQSLAAIDGLDFDVHLMVANPDAVAPMFDLPAVTSVTVHPETCPHLHRTLQAIRQRGCQAGVVLNPATPIEWIEWVLDELDQVLVMSVNPGFGGQAFIPSALEKLRRLAQLRAERGLDFVLSIDGGVNADTVAACVQAGADWLVAGSAVFSNGEPAERYTALAALAAAARS